MAVTSRNIKCPKCAVFTTNADYCKSCGMLISHKKKEEIRAEAINEQIVNEEKYKIENPNWVIRLKKHPFVVYRVLGYLMYSVIFVVSAIGSVLAWSIAMLAAG